MKLGVECGDGRYVSAYSRPRTALLEEVLEKGSYGGYICIMGIEVPFSAPANKYAPSGFVARYC